ncbi:MAG: hypothetical protein V3U49_00400 [Nitrososphaerales archaeon]
MLLFPDDKILDIVEEILEEKGQIGTTAISRALADRAPPITKRTDLEQSFRRKLNRMLPSSSRFIQVDGEISQTSRDGESYKRKAKVWKIKKDHAYIKKVIMDELSKHDSPNTTLTKRRTRRRKKKANDQSGIHDLINEIGG